MKTDADFKLDVNTHMLTCRWSTETKIVLFNLIKNLMLETENAIANDKQISHLVRDLCTDKIVDALVSTKNLFGII